MALLNALVLGLSCALRTLARSSCNGYGVCWYSVLRQLEGLVITPLYYLNGRVE